MRSTTSHAPLLFEPVRRLASASANIGLSLFGAGLLALAAVEAGLLVQGEAHVSAALDAADHSGPPPGSTGDLHGLAPSESAPFFSETTPALPGLGAQESTQRPPTVVGIAAVPTNNGTILYRLLSTGRIESSSIGSEGTWGQWVHVAPGERGGRTPPPGDN